MPETGAAILAPNHFSYMDHFLIGIFIRRKVRFMAKSQLFTPGRSGSTLQGGVFPVRRGARDDEAFVTAETILARGGVVAMYPEGGRSRTGNARRARQARDRAAGARHRRAGRADRDPRLGEDPQLEAAAVPARARAVRRAAALRAPSRTRRASASRRSPTRSSPRSARSTRDAEDGRDSAGQRSAPTARPSVAVTDGPTTLRVAAVQLNATATARRTSQRPTGSCARRRRAARGSCCCRRSGRCSATGAQLRAGAEALDGPVDAAGRATARASSSIELVAGSFTERSDGRAPSTTPRCTSRRDGEIRARYRKIHMFDVTVDGLEYRESEHEDAGRGDRRVARPTTASSWG